MLVSRGPLPTGPGWTYEVKWDGIRGQAAIAHGRVMVRSRPGRDCTASFPELAEPPARLTERAAVLDGEIVWLDPDGHPTFAAVRARLAGAPSKGPGRLAFMAFDLLSLDGETLLDLPYRERRALLHELGLDSPTWRVPPSFADPEALLEATRAHELEGVVAKRLGSPYLPGTRSSSWVKRKHLRRERLTVVGHSRAARRGAALLVASPNSEGELRYRGLVELGLGRDDLWQALGKVERRGCPLPWRRPPRGVTWVEPTLDVEVSCHGRGGALREATVRAVGLASRAGQNGPDLSNRCASIEHDGSFRTAGTVD